MNATQIEKQLDAVEGQLRLVRGWQTDDGAKAAERCDTLVAMAKTLREMVVDHKANPPKRRKPAPLGSEQKGFLRSVFNNGPYGSSRWVWGSGARSVRLAESLVRRELLLRDTDPTSGRTDYILTAKGREEIRRMEAEKS